MDKTTLGSAAILGIRSFLLEFMRPSSWFWSPGKQLIWLRTSAWPFLRCDLSIYLLVDIIGAAIYPRLISSDGLNSLTSPGLGLSSTWVIWHSSFLKTCACKDFRSPNGWGVFRPQQLSVVPSQIISCNITVWAVALCAHAACKNFAGLFVVRLILGACEGSITAGFLIVTSMFYTRNEQTVRVGWWCEWWVPIQLLGA